MKHPSPKSPQAQAGSARANIGTASYLVSAALRVVLCLCAIVFPLLTLSFALYYWIPYPFWDDWKMLPFYEAMEFGTLNWRDLFALHEGHRIVLVRLTSLVSAKIFNGANYLVLVVQIMLHLCLAWILWHRLHLASRNTSLKWASVAIALSIPFSHQAIGIWFQGFCIQQSFTVVFYVLAMHFATRDGRSHYAVGMSLLFCALASLSSALGLLVWPVLIVLLVVRKARYTVLSSAFALAVVTIGLYVTKWDGGGLAERSLTHAATAGARIKYFLSFMGSPFSADRAGLALIMGILGFAIYLSASAAALRDFVRRREACPRGLFFLSVPLLTVGTAAAAATTRFVPGLSDLVIPSRYALQAGLFWYGIAGLFWLKADRIATPTNAIRNTALLGAWVLLVLFLGTRKNIQNSIQICEDVRLSRTALSYRSYLYKDSAHNCCRLYPSARAVVSTYMPTLKSLNYPPFDAVKMLAQTASGVRVPSSQPSQDRCSLYISEEVFAGSETLPFASSGLVPAVEVRGTIRTPRRGGCILLAGTGGDVYGFGVYESIFARIFLPERSRIGWRGFITRDSVGDHVQVYRVDRANKVTRADASMELHPQP